MKAWHKLLGLSIAASSLVVGCVVGTDDGGGGSGGFGAAGTAGTSGSGGTTGGTGGATGGTTTGGTGGSTGGSGGTTGGSGGSTGGTGGSTGYTCDMPATDDCSVCAAAKCCTEYLDCVNDPDCLSSDGSSGDMACMITCTEDVFTANQAVTQQDVTTCASMCSATMSIIGPSANALVACIDTVEADSGGATNCGLECFSLF